jgi:Rrf2 family transcriptional regulator, iron-sulfur cluster assembly transcription factor
MELIRRNTDYALRVLTLMGLSGADKIFYARDLAAAENVPIVFLHKILQKLAAGKILRSHRGRFGGGFSLRGDPGGITLKDIMDIMQGPFAVNRCYLEKGKCQRLKTCPLHRQLLAAQKEIENTLGKLKLDTLTRARAKLNK